jgi:hypothetical protein
VALASRWLLGLLSRARLNPVWLDPVSCSRSSVGSGTGARTVGAGGDSSTFAMDRSPAAMVTFPVPATSNAAGGFPALRFPACFMPGVMGPILLGVLWAQVNDESDSR